MCWHKKVLHIHDFFWCYQECNLYCQTILPLKLDKIHDFMEKELRGSVFSENILLSIISTGLNKIGQYTQQLYNI